MFESFSFLDRSWETRVLEAQSLRRIFLLLLPSVFMFGMVAAMTLYEALHLHRFNWADTIILACLALPIGRLARLIYRRLGS